MARVAGCRQAACSPVTVEVSGRGTDPAPGAGCLLAGSIESPELASSLVFRLPASCWEALVPLLDVVLRLPAGTAGFFFLCAIASLTSLTRIDETCELELAFLKANLSCLSMVLRQEHSKCLPHTPPLYLCWRLNPETSSVNNPFHQSAQTGWYHDPLTLSLIAQLTRLTLTPIC
jgi:hypothetical protein